MHNSLNHGLPRPRLGWMIVLPILLVLAGCPTTSDNSGNGNDNDPPPGQEIDADLDGVLDEDDECPDTPAEADVNEVGCALSQLDSDDDGVTDDLDDCPETPQGSNVDATGCLEGGPPPDADGDGVSDANDDCPATPAGAEVDDDGCAASQRDTDRDGVNDALDQCPNTPAGAEVDAQGCADSQRDSDDDGVNDDLDACPGTAAGVDVDETGCELAPVDSDGDGISDAFDRCPNTPAGTQVDANGCPVGPGGGPGASCGNLVIEEGEQCDPPDGATCDANCQLTSGGGLTNDACGRPIAIGEGTRSFSNLGATTDGPDQPNRCAVLGDTQFSADIWYCYTPTCTGSVAVSLCCSAYDTKLAVYDGCACPTADGLLGCSDDDCGTSTTSRLTFPAVAGQSYLLRIGGFDGDQGEGTMSIFCADDPDAGDNACMDGSGDCFAGHDGAGCQDADTCSRVCDVDPCCCDTEWDALCAEKADGIINGFAACGAAGSGDCFGAHATPGCDQVDCCQQVCEEDPFCCLTQWDDVCAEAVETTCGLFDVCRNAVGSCFAEHATPGCNTQACCNTVCAADSNCCTSQWDELCTARAVQGCGR